MNMNKKSITSHEQVNKLMNPRHQRLDQLELVNKQFEKVISNIYSQMEQQNKEIREFRKLTAQNSKIILQQSGKEEKFRQLVLQSFQDVSGDNPSLTTRLQDFDKYSNSQNSGFSRSADKFGHSQKKHYQNDNEEIIQQQQQNMNIMFQNIQELQQEMTQLKTIKRSSSQNKTPKSIKMSQQKQQQSPYREKINSSSHKKSGKSEKSKASPLRQRQSTIEKDSVLEHIQQRLSRLEQFQTHSPSRGIDRQQIEDKILKQICQETLENIVEGFDNKIQELQQFLEQLTTNYQEIEEKQQNISQHFKAQSGSFENGDLRSELHQSINDKLGQNEKFQKEQQKRWIAQMDQVSKKFEEIDGKYQQITNIVGNQSEIETNFERIQINFDKKILDSEKQLKQQITQNQEQLQIQKQFLQQLNEKQSGQDPDIVQYLDQFAEKLDQTPNVEDINSIVDEKLQNYTQQITELFESLQKDLLQKQDQLREEFSGQQGNSEDYQDLRKQVEEIINQFQEYLNQSIEVSEKKIEKLSQEVDNCAKDQVISGVFDQLQDQINQINIKIQTINFEVQSTEQRSRSNSKTEALSDLQDRLNSIINDVQTLQNSQQYSQLKLESHENAIQNLKESHQNEGVNNIEQIVDQIQENIQQKAGIDDVQEIKEELEQHIGHIQQQVEQIKNEVQQQQPIEEIKTVIQDIQQNSNISDIQEKINQFQNFEDQQKQLSTRISELESQSTTFSQQNIEEMQQERQIMVEKLKLIQEQMINENNTQNENLTEELNQKTNQIIQDLNTQQNNYQQVIEQFQTIQNNNQQLYQQISDQNDQQRNQMEQNIVEQNNQAKQEMEEFVIYQLNEQNSDQVGEEFRQEINDCLQNMQEQLDSKITENTNVLNKLQNDNLQQKQDMQPDQNSTEQIQASVGADLLEIQKTIQQNQTEQQEFNDWTVEQLNSQQDTITFIQQEQSNENQVQPPQQENNQNQVQVQEEFRVEVNNCIQSMQTQLDEKISENTNVLNKLQQDYIHQQQNAGNGQEQVIEQFQQSMGGDLLEIQKNIQQNKTEQKEFQEWTVDQLNNQQETIQFYQEKQDNDQETEKLQNLQDKVQQLEENQQQMQDLKQTIQKDTIQFLHESQSTNIGTIPNESGDDKFQEMELKIHQVTIDCQSEIETLKENLQEKNDGIFQNFVNQVTEQFKQIGENLSSVDNQKEAINNLIKKQTTTDEKVKKVANQYEEIKLDIQRQMDDIFNAISDLKLSSASSQDTEVMMVNKKLENHLEQYETNHQLLMKKLQENEIQVQQAIKTCVNEEQFQLQSQNLESSLFDKLSGADFSKKLQSSNADMVIDMEQIRQQLNNHEGQIKQIVNDFQQSQLTSPTNTLFKPDYISQAEELQGGSSAQLSQKSLQKSSKIQSLASPRDTLEIQKQQQNLKLSQISETNSVLKESEYKESLVLSQSFISKNQSYAPQKESQLITNFDQSDVSMTVSQSQMKPHDINDKEYWEEHLEGRKSQEMQQQEEELEESQLTESDVQDKKKKKKKNKRKKKSQTEFQQQQSSEKLEELQKSIDEDKQQGWQQAGDKN